MLNHVNHTIIDLTVPQDLLGYDDFVTIYRQPQPYLAEALRLITSSEISKQQKMVIGYAMQRLDDDNLLGFSWAALRFLRAGLISPEVYDVAVFDTFHYRNLWLRRGGDQAVAAYLRAASKTPQVGSRTSSFISRIYLDDTQRAWRQDAQSQ